MAVSFTADGIECVLVEDGGGGLPAAAMFGNVPEAERDAALGERLRPDGRVLHPYGCLVLRTGGSVVLVDTGLGPYEHPYGGSGGRLEAELDHLGLVPADVDVLVITHGHLDHIGGLCRDGSPRFVRARHLMSEQAWRWWTDEANLPGMSSIGAQVAREQLRRWTSSSPGRGGRRAGPAPAGRARPLARTGRARARRPHPLPGRCDRRRGARHASGLGDVLRARPRAVQRTRRELLGRAADEGLLVAAPHLPFAATVERAGHGFHLSSFSRAP